MSNQIEAGLRGVAVAKTAIATVGKEGAGLTYRGYDIADLTREAGFEEVAYLLLYGHLPTAAELADYTDRLIGFRTLPEDLKEILERIPASASPMDMLRTACSMLGTLEPEESTTPENAQRISDRLLAVFPATLAYWHHFARTGRSV